MNLNYTWAFGPQWTGWAAVSGRAPFLIGQWWGWRSDHKFFCVTVRAEGLLEADIRKGRRLLNEKANVVELKEEV